MEDFPSLSERDLAYARLFYRFGEKPGRPRKQLAIHRKRRGIVMLLQVGFEAEVGKGLLDGTQLVSCSAGGGQDGWGW